MSQYIFILVWIAAMFFLKSVMSGGYRVENILGKKEYRVSWGFAAFAFCPVVIMATFRGDMGDSYAYKTMFRNLPNTISGLLNYIPSVTKDKGFSALSGIIKCIFGSNDVVYFCVLASIQAIILVTIYRKYSTNYLLSIFLFIASTDYLSWMFNGVRQFAAVTIIFASTKFMLEKKWVPTILMILLASTMHQSALVMIPIVIIVQGKAWNKRTILFLSAALVAVTFVNQFTSILDAIRGNSHYMKLLSPKQLYRWLVSDEYDIVISYLEGPSARIVAGCPKNKTKIVSWIHCTYHNKEELAKSFRDIKEAYKCYEKSDRMIFVSEEVKQAFIRYCPIKCETHVLYNTNESEKIIVKAAERIEEDLFKKNTFFWCGVGKIVPNKGFDRMIRIQRRLLEEGYDVQLLILGTGWQQKELENLCEENGVSNAVTFLGYQTNPYKYVSNCDLFVCASYAEGFSTATTEALIVGTPVCTVNVSGMKEMLGENDEFGVIVENNEEALYSGIKKLMDNPELLKHYKNMSIQRGKAFSTAETVNAVQNMLIRLMEE